MNVASLELSKELYKLSGWVGTEYHYFHDKRKYQHSDKPVSDGHKLNIGNHVYQPVFSSDEYDSAPAYDAGYLLRKLPVDRIYTMLRDVIHHGDGAKTNRYTFRELSGTEHLWADTAEDALCKLAIELWKSGVLK